MSSLMFLIYISAMGVAIALGRQAKRQRAEIALQCASLGLTPLPERPRVRMLEALLGISIGLILLLASALGLSILLSVPSPEGRPGVELTDLTLLLFAAGLALVVLGAAAVRQNLTFSRTHAERIQSRREPVQ
jgi:hypothetical protein